MTIFTLAPLFPLVLDVIQPLNESRQLDTIIFGDFPFDKHKYFAEVYALEFGYCFLSVTAVCAVDCVFIVLSEHCVGLLRIVK